MEQSSDRRTLFQAEVAGRFGILPNFFRSARAAPELIEQLWSFARDPVRVLLIEDHKDAADTLSELIDLIGFDVDVAYDGRSALVRGIATSPDLVL
jgi:PleD family two-component response regulator